MGEPTFINMGLSIDNDTSVKSRVREIVTLKVVIEWINSLELDEPTTKGLIDIAATYPTAALPSFKRNYQILLNRVRSKIKKESEGKVDE